METQYITHVQAVKTADLEVQTDCQAVVDKGVQFNLPMSGVYNTSIKMTS